MPEKIQTKYLKFENCPKRMCALQNNLHPYSKDVIFIKAGCPIVHVPLSLSLSLSLSLLFSLSYSPSLPPPSSLSLFFSLPRSILPPPPNSLSPSLFLSLPLPPSLSPPSLSLSHLDGFDKSGCAVSHVLGTLHEVPLGHGVGRLGGGQTTGVAQSWGVLSHHRRRRQHLQVKVRLAYSKLVAVVIFFFFFHSPHFYNSLLLFCLQCFSQL